MSFQMYVPTRILFGAGQLNHLHDPGIIVRIFLRFYDLDCSACTKSCHTRIAVSPRKYPAPTNTRFQTNTPKKELTV